MWEYELTTDIIGAFCTLLTPYKGCTDAMIVGEIGNDYIVRVNNGYEICGKHSKKYRYASKK